MSIQRILFTLLVLLFAACGGPATNTSAPAPTVTAGAAGSAPLASSGKRDVILATTTSTQDSGLLDVLIPEFERESGYKVKPIAVGTGEALKLGENGEADVLLVHAPKSEEEFMATGAGVNRTLVMHNDFVIVGPPNDPAGVKRVKTAADAFKTIAAKKAAFFSRGDDSGTHKKEVSIWEKTGDPEPQGAWYKQTGTGMGQTLRVASEKRGYTLTDRATYLSQRDTLDLDVLAQGEKSLLNVYHVIVVNPEKFPMVNAKGAQAFADFLVSPDAQKMIGEFGRSEYGQPLFVPDAGKSEAALR